MPTATLRYTLPDEQAEFDAARQGAEAKSVLWDIDQRLRSILKHGDPSPETAALAEEIRRMIADSPEGLLD
jgi:hypothetical protein